MKKMSEYFSDSLDKHFKLMEEKSKILNNIKLNNLKSKFKKENYSTLNNGGK